MCSSDLAFPLNLWPVLNDMVADTGSELSELVRIIDHLLSTEAPFGTYNATNDGPLESWADITRRIFQLARRDDLTVTNTTTAEYFAGKDGIAPRPLGSNMSLEKLHATGFSSRDWTYELKDYILNQKEFS